MRFGNMSIVNFEDGDIAVVKCHCGHKFRASVTREENSPVPLVDPKDRTIIGNGDGKIKCKDCGCVWKKTLRKDPKPKPWKYFYVTVVLEGDKKEHPALLVRATSIEEATLVHLPRLFDQAPIVSFTMREVDREEFNTLHDEHTAKTDNILHVLREIFRSE